MSVDRETSSLPLDHHLLDLADRFRGVQTLGAGVGTVHDGVAAIEPEGVFQIVQTLAGLLVAGVGQPPIRLQEDGGAQVLLRVPPVRGARGRAARAQDALVQPVQLPPFGLALTILLALMVWDGESLAVWMPVAMRGRPNGCGARVSLGGHIHLVLVCPFEGMA